MGSSKPMLLPLFVLVAAIWLARPSHCAKLRVLALHGHRHNGGDLCHALSSWDNSILDLVEFTCIDAPFSLGPNSYSWCDPATYWCSRADARADKTTGIASVLDYVSKTGPYDGLFGHSEGGFVAGVLGGIIEKRIEVLGRRAPDDRPPHFVIIHEGGVWDGLPEKVFTSPLMMKSLHVVGNLDWRRPGGVLLASKYFNSVLVDVDIAHVQPTAQNMDENLTRRLIDFLHSVAEVVAVSDPTAHWKKVVETE